MEVSKPAEDKPPHEDAPPSKEDHHDEEKGSDADAAIMQEWILKLGLFGAGCVFIMWLVSGKRRRAYEALKQDAKSTA